MHKTLFAARDKEQRRSALIEAANAVFAERGYDAATTREIAERAGCAEGLIHRYFNGKRGLLLAILDQRAVQVERILMHELDSKWERRDFMRVCISQAAIDPETGAAIRERVVDRQVAVIAAKLQAHQNAGRIRPEVDIYAMARTISGIGFATGFMLRVAFGASREEAERIVQGAAGALANGISTEPEEDCP
jgi:AcrR family transcriptional regulator